MLETWLAGLAPIAATMLAVWVASLVLNDVSIVDPAWPVLFVLAALGYAVAGDGPLGPRGLLALGCVTLWALRLGGYLAWRKRVEPGEDRRYRAMRRRFGPSFRFSSLAIVFALQASLAWIVSLPLLAAIASSDAPLGALDAIGVALWCVGVVFETVGDWQLARFKAKHASEGQVLRSGLWRYTRHPNYFGDFCVWWGLFAIALAGGGWWSVPGPLLMSVLLLRVSGVTLLERDIAQRRSGYADYVRSTNAFFPGPPREPPMRRTAR